MFFFQSVYICLILFYFFFTSMAIHCDLNKYQKISVQLTRRTYPISYIFFVFSVPIPPIQWKQIVLPLIRTSGATRIREMDSKTGLKKKEITKRDTANGFGRYQTDFKICSQGKSDNSRKKKITNAISRYCMNCVNFLQETDPFLWTFSFLIGCIFMCFFFFGLKRFFLD